MLIGLIVTAVWIAGISLLLAFNHASCKARDKGDQLDTWQAMLADTLNDKNDH